MSYKNKYVRLNREYYLNQSISELEGKIEAIKTIKAATEKKTLELKIASIKNLPKLINDGGIKYKKYVDWGTLEVKYKIV